MSTDTQRAVQGSRAGLPEALSRNRRVLGAPSVPPDSMRMAGEKSAEATEARAKPRVSSCRRLLAEAGLSRTMAASSEVSAREFSREHPRHQQVFLH